VKLPRLQAVWHELEAGTEVEVLLDGKHVPAHVVQLKDREQVVVKWDNLVDVNGSDLDVDEQSNSILPLSGLSHAPSKFAVLDEKKFVEFLGKELNRNKMRQQLETMALLQKRLAITLKGDAASRRVSTEALAAADHAHCAQQFFAREHAGGRQAGGRRPPWLPPKEIWTRLQDWKLLVGIHKHGWDNGVTEALEDTELGLGELLRAFSSSSGVGSDPSAAKTEVDMSVPAEEPSPPAAMAPEGAAGATALGASSGGLLPKKKLVCDYVKKLLDWSENPLEARPKKRAKKTGTAAAAAAADASTASSAKASKFFQQGSASVHAMLGTAAKQKQVQQVRATTATSQGAIAGRDEKFGKIEDMSDPIETLSDKDIERIGKPKRGSIQSFFKKTSPTDREMAELVAKKRAATERDDHEEAELLTDKIEKLALKQKQQLTSEGRSVPRPAPKAPAGPAATIAATIAAAKGAAPTADRAAAANDTSRKSSKMKLKPPGSRTNHCPSNGAEYGLQLQTACANGLERQLATGGSALVRDEGGACRPLATCRTCLLDVRDSSAFGFLPRDSRLSVCAVWIQIRQLSHQPPLQSPLAPVLPIRWQQFRPSQNTSASSSKLQQQRRRQWRLPTLRHSGAPEWSSNRRRRSSGL
jgi:hypothetical protein